MLPDWISNPIWQHTFVSSSAFSGRAAVSLQDRALPITQKHYDIKFSDINACTHIRVTTIAASTFIEAS